MNFSLTTEELAVQTLARDFAEREIEPLVEQIEQEHKTPHELLKKFADVGMLGMEVPTEYGGAGASILSHLLALEELAKSGTGVEWLLGLNNSIPTTLNHFASEQIKEKYLPSICNGTKCASLMFTEPETGSHPAMITTTAKPSGDYYILNGQKRFITWGAWDGPAIVFAKDDTGKVSGFIVEKNVDG